MYTLRPSSRWNLPPPRTGSAFGSRAPNRDCSPRPPGDRERAADQLERAASAFESAGAIRRRSATERELRRLGRPVTYRRTRAGAHARPGIESLTVRELQIARLIVDRRTN